MYLQTTLNLLKTIQNLKCLKEKKIWEIYKDPSSTQINFWPRLVHFTTQMCLLKMDALTDLSHKHLSSFVLADMDKDEEGDDEAGIVVWVWYRLGSPHHTVRCLGQVLDSLSFWVSPELELPAFGGNQLLDKISLTDYPLSVSVPFKWTNWAREKDTHIQSSKYLDSSWDGENELEQELGQKTSSCLKVSLLDSKTGRECRWQT